MELRGTVVRERIGSGTKSERDAILLVTPEGRRLQLRLRGGNPLYDTALEPFVGCLVTGQGEIHGPVAIFFEPPRIDGSR